jgi:hypothetical protein
LIFNLRTKTEASKSNIRLLFMAEKVFYTNKWKKTDDGEEVETNLIPMTFGLYRSDCTERKVIVEWGRAKKEVIIGM